MFSCILWFILMVSNSNLLRKLCQTLGISAPHEPKFGKKWKVPRSPKKWILSILRYVLIVFGCKWCAALSSVVRHGKPVGQKIRFNANSVEQSILGLVVSFSNLYLKNWFQKRFLKYFIVQIDGFKLEFAYGNFVNLWVFRRLMNPNLAKN